MSRKLLPISAFLTLLLLTLCIYVIPVSCQEEKTITLRPIADTYVDSDSPNNNFGGDNHLSVHFGDYDYIEDTHRHAYLMFDLSIFPSGADIVSAELQLYAWSAWSPTPKIGAHFCDDNSWSEIEITWNNAPSFSTKATDVIPVPFDDEWYSWDITEDVEEAAGGKLTEVLKVESTGDTFSTSFYSKDGWRNPPEIVVKIRMADTDPPEYDNVRVTEEYVRAGQLFAVSVDLSDPSGISEAYAVFLDYRGRETGRFTLEGTGSSGTYTGIGAFESAAGDGTYNIKIIATDGLGNTGTSKIVASIILDDTPPILGSVEYQPSYPNPENKVVVTARAIDEHSRVQQVTLLYSTDGFWNEVAMFFTMATTYESSIPKQADATTVKFYVKAFDKTGNTAESDSFSFTVDGTAPSLSITNPVNGTDFELAEVTVRWNGSDAVSGIDHYEVKLDDDAWITTTEESHKFTRLSERRHKVIIKAFDRAGNSKEASVVFTVGMKLAKEVVDSTKEGIDSAKAAGFWSGNAKALFNKAVNEYDAATQAFNEEDYENAKAYAEKAISYLKQAQEGESTFKMLVIGGIGGAIVIAAIAIFLLMRRKRKS